MFSLNGKTYRGHDVSIDHGVITIDGVIVQDGPVAPLPPVMESQPVKQDLTGDVAWLWTHCRALGMVNRSDSKLFHHDVALFIAQLCEVRDNIATWLEGQGQPGYAAEIRARDWL